MLVTLRRSRTHWQLFNNCDYPCPSTESRGCTPSRLAKDQDLAFTARHAWLTRFDWRLRLSAHSARWYFEVLIERYEPDRLLTLFAKRALLASTSSLPNSKNEIRI
jgi:hypothetical protein